MTGAGRLPDRPVLLAAYTGAAIASDGDIVVTWTSPSDPDYFVAAAEWSCGPGCGAGMAFEAEGSARQLTIPRGALPPGRSVDVAVFAYDDGALQGDYAPSPGDPGMNIRSESSRIAVVTGASGPPPPALEVRGQDIGEAYANVYVTQNQRGLDDAVVVANGRVLAHVPGSSGLYSGGFAPLLPGDPLSLEVTRGGLRVTGVGALPDAPLIASPTSGTRFAPAEDVVVAWTSPTDPDAFDVIADWACGPSCGTGTEFLVAGSSRSFAIPHGALPSGTIELRVFAYDDGTFTGDYAPYPLYPGLHLRAESGPVTISR